MFAILLLVVSCLIYFWFGARFGAWFGLVALYLFAGLVVWLDGCVYCAFGFVLYLVAGFGFRFGVFMWWLDAWDWFGYWF